jgi:mono/diheme cytochrome c family protein
MRTWIAASLGAMALMPFAMAQSRGEMLYATHCIGCHTTQLHWRDKRTAVDWASLQFEVRRWQDAASLGWSDTDIADVARYLNQRIYRFEQPRDPQSGGQMLPSRSVQGRARSTAG